jgi:hypothetical protein
MSTKIELIINKIKKKIDQINEGIKGSHKEIVIQNLCWIEALEWCLDTVKEIEENYKPEISACKELDDILFQENYTLGNSLWQDVNRFSEKYESVLKQIPKKE